MSFSFLQRTRFCEKCTGSAYAAADVFEVDQKQKQVVAPWLCFSVAVDDQKQLPHIVCGLCEAVVDISTTVLPGTP